MAFPRHRMRRLRGGERVRALVRETTLRPDAFIYPVFVCPGEGIRREISSMPGQYQLSVDQLVEVAREAEQLGIGGMILFGLPDEKDAEGTGAWKADGIVQTALRALRETVSDLLLVGDVCLCEYTDHGHCGLVREGRIDNDPTLELLARTARTQAEAGADIVAPSDMMDGRVAAIRSELDSAGLAEVPIMSYAAKYASAYYGPFREAAGSAPRFGDRRTHQMDPSNAREALREIEMDIAEGADIVIVKPALGYLDIVQRAREAFSVPVAAFQVSGEYAMIEAAARNGWLDRDRTIHESLVSIVRAGADIVLTYYALEVARTLR